MSDMKNPVPGDQGIDSTEFKLKDLTPEHLNSLTKLREGYKKALSNLANMKPEYMEMTGINPKEVARVLSVAEEHERLVMHHEASAKLTELLYETKQDRGHLIATSLAETAAHIRRRAERAPNSAEILGPVAELLDYQSGPAYRAAATREKKAAPPKENDAAGKPGTEKPEKTAKTAPPA